jgi:propanol-preferring alcohol dehydrogenase
MHAVQLSRLHAALTDADVAQREPGPGEVRVAIRACGICHSDAHYRAGTGRLTLPRTLGHEIAGVVAETGARVAVHYLLSCGTCERCVRSGEQFCSSGQMIGKECDGGYAESIVVPARNLVAVPDNVPLDVAAVMMCSTATAYHALRLAEMTAGASILVLGFGGLGFSALQLGKMLGAERVGVVDIVPEKLALARDHGAVTADVLDARYDIALDFVGKPALTVAALRALEPKGRLVLVALSEAPLDFNPYRDVLAHERRIIGSSDHTRQELVELMTFAGDGRLDIAPVISRRIARDAAAINATLDDLDRGTASFRTVISSR